MVEYRELSRPTTLKSAELTADDEAAMANGVDAAIGLDLESPRQLEMRYLNGRTIVDPVNPPADLKPWTFTGYVSPDDCRTWYLAKHG